MSDTSGPAFPEIRQMNEHDDPTSFGPSGLTKRELFAAMAMQGMVAERTAPWSDETVAQGAVILADALLAELAKEPPR